MEGLNGHFCNGFYPQVRPKSQLLEYKHIPEAAIRKMQTPIHLIRIVPAEADYLNSDFKKDGYDSRQHILF
jgi:hypothetical protein